MRTVSLATALALLVGCAPLSGAAAEGPTPIAEADLLRLRALQLEQGMIEAQLGRVQAEARLELERRAMRLQSLAHEAATRAGIDPTTHEADVNKGVWRPKPGGKPTSGGQGR